MTNSLDICLSKCPDSVCLKKCLNGEADFSLEEEFYNILEKVLEKGIVIRGEIGKINRGNVIEAVAKVDEQTWLMHIKLPAVEGKCRKLRDIIFEDKYIVQSKLCYENGDYWLKIKYWKK